MLLTKKALSRRTLLRGTSAALALPLLDAMIPAATAIDNTLANPKRRARLGYIFVAMGADMSRFTPRSRDTLDGLSPILRPLAPFKDDIAVVTNTYLPSAYPGSHATSNSAFLSCARAKLTESSDYELGITADQVVAQQLGHATKLPSIEMAMDILENTGQCDNGYACVYQNNLVWSSANTPLPSEAHPRIIFESLFGNGGSTAERLAAAQRRASLLDAVLQDMHSLQTTLNAADRQRLDAYFTAIRELERRIQSAERDVEHSDLPALQRPMSVPANYGDHARLMLDLLVLAWQGDVTRVATMQLVREASTRTYPEIGVSDSHHPLSHHGNDPHKLARLARVNEYHAALFAHLVQRLKDTPEGDGSLLDTSLFLYGSGMGDPNLHDHHDLPIVVAGGRALGKKGNLHLRYDAPTPLANVHLALMRRCGTHIERFADSTGEATELFFT